MQQIKVRALVMVLQEPRQGGLCSIHQYDLALESQVWVFWKKCLDTLLISKGPHGVRSEPNFKEHHK